MTQLTHPRTPEEPRGPTTPGGRFDAPAGVRVRAAVVWSYLLGGGHFLAYGAVTLLLAAILLPEAFGVMALAMLWVSFAQMLLHEGPSLAVIQRAELTDRHLDAAFWINLATAAVIAGVFAAAAPLWAAAVHLPELAPVCWALAPVIVLHALQVVPDALLRRQLAMRRLVSRVLLATVVAGACGVAAALAGLGVWALVINHVTYSTVAVVLLWTATGWRPRRGPVRAAARDLRRFSLLSVSEFLSGFVAQRADALLAGLFFSPVAIGLYRFCLRITEMAGDLAVYGVRQITVPHLSRMQHDPATFARHLAQLVHAGVVLAFPALGVLAAVAPPLLALLGPEWTEATGALRLLCVLGAVAVVGNLLLPAMQAAGRPGIAAAVGWTTACLAAALIVLVGAAYATASPAVQVVAMAVTMIGVQAFSATLTLLVTVRRVLRTPLAPLLRPTLPAATAAVAAAVVGGAVADRIPGSVPAVGALAAAGLVAAATAATVLLATDAQFSHRLRQTVRRTRTEVG